MNYTKHLVALVVLATISTSSIASAATGATASTGSTTPTPVPTSTAPDATSLEVKGAPRLIKKTSDSVVLEWDKVPAASAYIVKYSKNSVANSTDITAQYDNETDAVTTTGAVITKLSTSNEKLTPATSYYFSVVAIDSNGKESDTFSSELMVTTDAATTPMMASGSTMSSGSTVSIGLSIKDLVVTDDKTLSLVFSADLSTDPVSVKITKTSDNSNVVVDTVAQDPTNPNAVIITTITPLSSASSYTLTVLAAKDTAGNNIQEGVSGLKEFITSETLKLNAPAAVPAPMAVTAASGATASGATATVNAAEVATKVATGTKENMIVLAALLLSLGIVYVYRRKLI
jgi:hypothetical protein